MSKVVKSIILTIPYVFFIKKSDKHKSYKTMKEIYRLEKIEKI